MRIPNPWHWLRQPCALCGLPAGTARVCGQCLEILPRNDSACDTCGQPVARGRPVPCADCQKSPPAFDRARSPLRYAFPVDVALKKLKFHGQLVYAPVFAELMLPVIESCFADCDALVPVPLHRWRHVTRGFNQADELCRTLGPATGLVVVTSVVRRRRTRPQSGLSADDRRRNLKNAFQVCGNFPWRRPLIIDDVVTTGSTCNELACVLKTAGADAVGVLTVARSATL